MVNERYVLLAITETYSSEGELRNRSVTTQVFFTRAAAGTAVEWLKRSGIEAAIFADHVERG